jgi:hypothetical protein
MWGMKGLTASGGSLPYHTSILKMLTSTEAEKIVLQNSSVLKAEVFSRTSPATEKLTDIAKSVGARLESCRN